MNKLFNNLRKKLITEGITTNPTFAKACATAKTLSNKRLSGTYIKYAIGEIVLVVVLNKTKSCPVRDKLWVATSNNELYPRAFRPACRQAGTRYIMYLPAALSPVALKRKVEQAGLTGQLKLNYNDKTLP